MNRKQEDWIEALREAATSGREDKLPEALWDRISATLDAERSKSVGRRRRLWLLGTAASAAAVIAFAIFLTKTAVRDVTEPGMQPIAQGVVQTAPGDFIDDGSFSEAASAVVDQAPPTTAKGVNVVGDIDRVATLPPKAEGEIQQTGHQTAAPAEPPTETVSTGDASKGKESSGQAENQPASKRVDIAPMWGASSGFSDTQARTGRRSRRGTLALSATGVASVSNTSPGGNLMPLADASLNPNRQGLMTMTKFSEKYSNLYLNQYSYRHRQPLTFALSFDIDLGHNIFVGAGVSYTRLLSKVSTLLGDSEFNQTLQYVGIPVSFRWAFLDTRYITLYAGLEGQVEFLAAARFGDQKISDRRTQWSAHALAGAQVNLGKHIGIYVEPKLSHYFVDTRLHTIRNTSGVNFNLQLGLRFSY